VFAAIHLKKGSVIPILGTPLSKEEFDARLKADPSTTSHCWSGYRSGYKFFATCGKPSREERRSCRAGNRGVSIAMLINEPSIGEKANCFFQGGVIVVAQDIAIGTQLLIHYGNEYLREYQVGAGTVSLFPHGVKGVVKIISDLVEELGE
jgi:hypothetical protein